MQRIKYSLYSILILTLIVALALFLRPTSWNPPTAQQRIRNILNDNNTDAQKIEKLSVYVVVGDHVKKIGSKLGPSWDFDTNEDGRFRHKYDSGLVIDFYPDGEAYAIGYFQAPRTRGSEVHWLAVANSINISKLTGSGLKLFIEAESQDR